METRKLFKILIPVAPNKDDIGVCDDRLTFVDERGGLYDPIFNNEYHNKFFDFVFDLVGGLTVCPRVSGQWKDSESGEIFREQMIPVEIGVVFESQIDEIAAFAKTHYNQLEIFVAEIGTARFY